MEINLEPDRPRVELTLRDGLKAVLSPLLPGDRHWLEEGFEELSIASRYSRFGIGLAHLSKSELDYLADVDQRSHVAWGAMVEGSGAGIGRYISIGDECPEVAVTVLDEFQGHGLGKLLMRALVAVARHDGVEALCFELAPDSTTVRLMLAEFTSHIGADSGRVEIGTVQRTGVEKELVDVIEQVRSRHAPTRD